jgi:hypothetical protein
VIHIAWPNARTRSDHMALGAQAMSWDGSGQVLVAAGVGSRSAAPARRERSLTKLSIVSGLRIRVRSVRGRRTRGRVGAPRFQRGAPRLTLSTLRADYHDDLVHYHDGTRTSSYHHGAQNHPPCSRERSTSSSSSCCAPSRPTGTSSRSASPPSHAMSSRSTRAHCIRRCTGSRSEPDSWPGMSRRRAGV